MRAALRSRFPSAWLTGEVQRLRRSGRGHLYFELVEKGAGDEIVAKLEAVVWRSDLEQIERELSRQEQSLADGIEIRCRAQVDFYAPFGRLQLVVRRVDPEFTLGLLSRRRRETLKQLAAAGLLDRNKKLALSPVPLRVGLVTSADSAAYHDFMSTLGKSGFAFDVRLLNSAVQGRSAERELAAALERASTLAIDCLVLIRGGGSRTDLAVFDSRRLAELLAHCPVPVITGLGHQIDEAVADLVAHTRTKTPTEAGAFLVRRIEDSETRVAVVGDRIVARSRDRLASSRAGVERLGRELGLARFRVAAAGARLGSLAEKFAASAGGRLDAAHSRLGVRGSQFRVLAKVRLREAGARVERLAVRSASSVSADVRRQSKHLSGLDRLLKQLSPERTLRRGFSITRTEGGKVLRSSAGVAVGSRLTTELADGVVRSRVEPR